MGGEVSNLRRSPMVSSYTTQSGALNVIHVRREYIEYARSTDPVETDNLLNFISINNRVTWGGVNRPPSDSPYESDSKIMIPHPEPMDTSCELYRTVLADSGRSTHMHYPHNITALNHKKPLYRDQLSASQRVALTGEMFPKYNYLIDGLNSKVFCGTYSNDGSLFVSSTQSCWIKLYDTKGPKFKCFKAIQARDIGWSILDTVFSPDQKWLAYSTWSPYIGVVNIHSNAHHSLDLRPEMGGTFCAFSVKFSADGNELFASSNDEHVYVYDRTKCDRVLAFHAHCDDVSALNVEAESSDIIYTGGDDGLCKVWDRRVLSEVSPRPVGVLAGHKDGITYIDPKGDYRYLITNSKDQSIKLWDLRKFSDESAIQATLRSVRNKTWDYRLEDVPLNTKLDIMKKLPGDSSVMTYGGHLVKSTLIRCRFSPRFTTGQRYIYAGCAERKVVIYDVLTGEMVATLRNKRISKKGVIRDVSWHPTVPGEIVTAGWDGFLTLWTMGKIHESEATFRNSAFDQFVENGDITPSSSSLNH